MADHIRAIVAQTKVGCSEGMTLHPDEPKMKSMVQVRGVGESAKCGNE